MAGGLRRLFTILLSPLSVVLLGELFQGKRTSLNLTTLNLLPLSAEISCIALSLFLIHFLLLFYLSVSFHNVAMVMQCSPNAQEPLAHSCSHSFNQGISREGRLQGMHVDQDGV